MTEYHYPGYVFVFDNKTHNLLGVFHDVHEANRNIDICEGEEPDLDYVDALGEMDHLKTMLTLQSHFQNRLGCEYDTQYIMNHILYAEAEMHEFLRELEGFKAWKQYGWSEEEKAIHLAAAKEEFIDVLHFIWNVALALGLDSKEIMEIYARKNAENHSRQDRGY